MPLQVLPMKQYSFFSVEIAAADVTEYAMHGIPLMHTHVLIEKPGRLLVSCK